MDVQVAETEPATRWRATTGDGAHEVGIFLGRIHRGQAWLEGGEGIPPPALRELAAALSASAGVPVVAKAVPGTSRHRQLMAAGGTVYQACPPSEVDGSRPDNAAWAADAAPDDAPDLIDLTEVDDAAALELWVSLYTWVHEEWAPVDDPDAVRAVFGPMLAQALDRRLSVVARRGGVDTAVAFAVRDREGSLCVVTEAVDPASPTAREDVGAVMRDVVRRCAEAGKAMFFDGHVSDPHYPQVLATIPHVTGPGLHLIRLGQPDDRPG